MKKFLSVIICAALLFCFPISAQASTKTGTIFNSSTYTHQTQFDGMEISEGVDLSYHNGSVDFEALKDAGVEYVILRAGYRGYAKEGTLNKDKKFDSYIQSAAAQGLDIGVYFYSQAITEDEAAAEANYTLNLINKYKSSITFPVAFDYEFAEVSSGRFDSAWSSGKLNKTKCTAIARSFCNTIEDAGYKSMIYANKSFLSDVIDGASLDDDYPIWLAHYTTSTSYSGVFHIWQFSSTGKISGVSGNVDSNFLYSGGFSIDKIPDATYTGSPIEPAVTAKYYTTPLTRDVDYTISYSNNVNVGKAQILLTGIGNYAQYGSKTFNFNIIHTHSYTSIITKEATCTKEGVITYTCVNGDDSKKEPIHALGHDWGDWTVVSNAIEATCTTVGKTAVEERTCKNDSNHKETRGGETIPATGHSYTGWEVTTSPRCVQNGIAIRICNICSLVERLVIPATGHNFVSCQQYCQNGCGTVNPDYVAPGAQTPATSSEPKTAKLSRVTKGKKSFTVQWKKVSGVDGYQIQYSTNKKMKKAKTKNVKGAKKTKVTVKKLKKGKKYYVRIRTYKTVNGRKVYSKWSAKKTVKTK